MEVNTGKEKRKNSKKRKTFTNMRIHYLKMFRIYYIIFNSLRKFCMQTKLKTGSKKRRVYIYFKQKDQVLHKKKLKSYINRGLCICHYSNYYIYKL